MAQPSYMESGPGVAPGYRRIHRYFNRKSSWTWTTLTNEQKGHNVEQRSASTGEANFDAKEFGAASQNFFCNIILPGKSSKTAVRGNYVTARIFERTLIPSTVMMAVWSTMREAEVQERKTVDRGVEAPGTGQQSRTTAVDTAGK
ncbi:hypothetical protein B0H19DRAFT_1065406 [Mycena capillaripes]|nr:hypothetical protein B0H19DRAFT_1065406 [Mycena capillaripes]